MELMTKLLRETIPPLLTADPTANPVAWVKYSDPSGSWNWYGLEFDGEDMLFGVIQGHRVEFGYFSLSELESTREVLGLGVERDLFFRPCRVSELPITFPTPQTDCGRRQP